MGINVRKYTDNDYDQVYVILKEVFNREKIKKEFDDNYIEFVAEVDNKIAGYFLLTRVYDVITERKYFLVDYVCVKDDYKRMGIAYEMMEYAYNFAKDDGASYLELHSNVKREAAHKLYEKCNYEKLDSYLYRREIV